LFGVSAVAEVGVELTEVGFPVGRVCGEVVGPVDHDIDEAGEYSRQVH
jgi:hypothetical protein